ncbi:hypothetical protein [Photorhabdus sp. RM323S]|uniref:hypothetical protein n=1 Tax=Photorhabdus sp. RM323S TaxID=3342828 RepID=UPI001414F1AC
MQRGWGRGNKLRPACWPAFRAVDLGGLTDDDLRQIWAPEPPRMAATAAVGASIEADSSGRSPVRLSG